MLIILKDQKPRSPAIVDRIVQCEVPPITVRPAWVDASGTIHPAMHVRDQELYDIVKAMGIHGPCDKEEYKHLACRSDPRFPDSCAAGHPMPPREETFVDTGGYPSYRRRGDVPLDKSDGTGRHTVLKFKKDPPLDNPNGWVTSNNSYLTKRYNCHINVQISTSIKSFKYIYK
jgi:hypothetical protein